MNGTGEQSRDFTYVDDAVDATVAAMDHGPAGAIYNVGGGAETSMLAVIEMCEAMSGRVLDVRQDEGAAGDVRRTAADTTRIRSEVGWSPKTPLADGLAAQFEHVLRRSTSRGSEAAPRGLPMSPARISRRPQR